MTLGFRALRMRAYWRELDINWASKERTWMTTVSKMRVKTNRSGGMNLISTRLPPMGKPSNKAGARTMAAHTCTPYELACRSCWQLRWYYAWRRWTCLTHWAWRNELPWKCGWKSPRLPTRMGANFPVLACVVVTVCARPMACLATGNGRTRTADFSIAFHNSLYLAAGSNGLVRQRAESTCQVWGHGNSVGILQTSLDTQVLNRWKCPWIIAWSGQASSMTSTWTSNCWSSGERKQKSFLVRALQVGRGCIPHRS